MTAAASRLQDLRYPNCTQDINDVWAHMQNMGFKDDAGLVRCDQFILMRDRRSFGNLFHAWWDEVQNCATRDHI